MSKVVCAALGFPVAFKHLDQLLHVSRTALHAWSVDARISLPASGELLKFLLSSTSSTIRMSEGL